MQVQKVAAGALQHEVAPPGHREQRRLRGAARGHHQGHGARSARVAEEEQAALRRAPAEELEGLQHAALDGEPEVHPGQPGQR